MAENSFDVVSKLDMQEVTNAVQNAMKEVTTRFDLKDTKSSIDLEKDAITLASSDDYKLKAVNDILQSKLVKRHIPLKNMQYGSIEQGSRHFAADHRHPEGCRFRIRLAVHELQK